MILTDDQARKIIKDNPNKTLLETARKDAKLLTMHVTGEGLTEAIEAMPYFEGEEVQKLRKKYGRSNKDVFERVLRPRDKVFTAKGGSKAYTLPQGKEKEFKAYLSAIRNDEPLEKWIEETALRAFDLDPMSVIYVEVDSEGRAYPTHKGTAVIYDYKPAGRRLEYIIFTLSKGEIAALVERGLIPEPDKDALVYRIVDDLLDRIAVRRGEEITFPSTASFPNYFMEVPGRIVSNIPVFNTELFKSSLDPVVELANDFLIDGSTKAISKKYHMFPKAWEVGTECNGTGSVAGVTCTVCKGSKENPYTKVSQVFKIYPETADGTGVKYPTPPFGYAVPPVAGWEMMNDELEHLEQLMERTYWGTKKMVKTTGPDAGKGQVDTATAVKQDNQPQIERCKKFSEWAQSLHKFIADAIGTFTYGNSYGGSSIVYGDKYMLESPEEVAERYFKAKKEGETQNDLRTLKLESLEAKYAGNPIQYRVHEILLDVEPFPFNNIDQVIAWPVSDEVKKMKLFFHKWRSTKKDAEIYNSTPQELEDELREFTATQEIIQPEPEQVKTKKTA